MTLQLSQVIQQIDDMGRVLAERAGRERQTLPLARELLRQFAHEQDFLRRIAEANEDKLGCASPGDEPLDAALPAAAIPADIVVMAADGSQVYPDPHGPAFYYLINVGTIVLRRGTGQAPQVITHPQVYYAEEDVYPEGDPATGDLVDALRGRAEILALADLARAEPASEKPRLALADGPLLIWQQPARLPKGYHERILDAHLACLDALATAQTPVAGFVSRPHSAEVVALLYLAQCDVLKQPAAPKLSDTPYRGLTDRALFGFLQPGERSALYVRGTPANREFRARGHTVCFFYLNTGSDVARVEVPQWVAGRGAWLDVAHSAILDQCVVNNGYPYLLTRADELAVIGSAERTALEEMIVRAMVQHGLTWPEASRKAAQKKVARWRR